MLIAIGNLVKKNLKGQIDINLVLSCSIRKQDYFLWSFFNHHHNLSGSFENIYLIDLFMKILFFQAYIIIDA